MTTHSRALWALAFLAAAPAVRAAPPADPNSIVTLQVENDAVSGTDKYYSSGLRLGYTAPTGSVPRFLERFGQWILGDGQQRLAIDLQQSIFTPAHTQVDNPDPRDRPYAGLLIANGSLIQDTDRSRTILGLGLGVVGPGSGAEEVQNGFHNLIGDTPNRGWKYQLDNEAIVQVSADRIWRVGLARFYGLELDALPSIGVAAGTWRDYAQLGAEIRLGQGLNSDFGAPRIRPGLSGGDAYVRTRPFVWYLYAGGDGQAVAYDTTLNGDYARSSRRVTPENLIGEFQAGLTLMAFGARLSAFHVIQTKTFTHQTENNFNFDGVSLSIKF